MVKEQRITRRIPTKVVASFLPREHAVSCGVVSISYTKDLSQFGARLISPAGLSIGQDVLLVLEVPTCFIPLVVHGEVAWIKEVKGRPFGSPLARGLNHGQVLHVAQKATSTGMPVASDAVKEHDSNGPGVIERGIKFTSTGNFAWQKLSSFLDWQEKLQESQAGEDKNVAAVWRRRFFSRPHSLHPVSD